MITRFYFLIYLIYLSIVISTINFEPIFDTKNKASYILNDALKEILDPILEKERSERKNSLGQDGLGIGVKKSIGIGIGLKYNESFVPYIQSEKEKYYIRKKQWNDIKNNNRNMITSSVRRRCLHYLACEFQIPMIEFENIIINNGVIYLHNLDKESKQVLNSLPSLFASKEGFLPSSLVQHFHSNDWIHGPKYTIVSTETSKSIQSFKCTNVIDSSIFFLFPWEIENAYHSMNDNVLAVLGSVILQYLNQPLDVDVSSDFHRRSLYLFTKLTKKLKSPTLIFKLLHLIFENDVNPAGLLLTNGPHCIRRLTWGTSMKMFYRDSLFQLRKIAYKVLRAVLLRSKEFPKLPAFDLRGDNKNIKVIIVTRFQNKIENNNGPIRLLTRKSEIKLKESFIDFGADATICCDYKVVNTTSKLLSYFGYTDICIGIHGAGMTNCMLGPESLVVSEFQTQHGIGFDSYMKMAHMASGSYIYVDVRNFPKKRDRASVNRLEHGIVVSDMIINLVTNASINQYMANKFNNNNNNINNNNNNFRNILINEDLATRNITINIFPSPTYIITKTGILGPAFMNNIETCKDLVYYKFRLMTMLPNDHKYYCDRNVIVRKPTSYLDGKLLTDFLEHDPTSHDGYFPSQYHTSKQSVTEAST